MQTEISQPKGEWIMPETRLASFPPLFIDPIVGISRSASGTGDLLFFLSFLEKS